MLTDAECKNATCPAGKNRARLACSGGLYLEVSPAGSKRWFWKYRKDGKEGRMALGSYRPVTRSDRLLTFFGVERGRDEPSVDVWPLGLAPFIRLAEDGSGNKIVEDGLFGLR